jgi:hypothetical protein
MTLYNDLIEFLNPVINAHVHTNAAGVKLFDVKHQRREKCPTGEKPVIYYNSINTGGQQNRATGAYFNNLEFRVGIIADCDNPKHAGRDLQISNLLDLFSSNSNQLYRWDMNFQGVSYSQTFFPHFGIQNMTVSNVVEYTTECKCTAIEFAVFAEVLFSTEPHVLKQ